jgi:hypothetical protein
MATPSTRLSSARRAFAPSKVLPVAGEPRRPGASPRLAKKVLFASAHSIVDFSNGASVRARGPEKAERQVMRPKGPKDGQCAPNAPSPNY